jgi:hypothetical protein
LIERGLTGEERALAASVFGAAINYERVRISNRKWAFFQPRLVVMAPRGAIHFHPENHRYCDDFCGAGLEDQGLFIHEMTHVWQHQVGINLILKRHIFCRYSYSLKPGWPLARYGIEQQAEIVRHAFLLSRGMAVPGAPSLEAYRAILPFAGS